MSACHDNSELDLRTDLQEPDELSGDGFVGLEVGRGRICSGIEQVHSVWSRLRGRVP